MGFPLIFARALPAIHASPLESTAVGLARQPSPDRSLHRALSALASDSAPAPPLIDLEGGTTYGNIARTLRPDDYTYNRRVYGSPLQETASVDSEGDT